MPTANKQLKYSEVQVRDNELLEIVLYITNYNVVSGIVHSKLIYSSKEKY